jgi:hypothetical protein
MISLSNIAADLLAHLAPLKEAAAWMAGSASRWFGPLAAALAAIIIVALAARIAVAISLRRHQPTVAPGDRPAPEEPPPRRRSPVGLAAVAALGARRKPPKKANAPPTTHPPLPPNVQSLARELRARGGSFEEIAELLNVSKATAYRLIKTGSPEPRQHAPPMPNRRDTRNG